MNKQRIVKILKWFFGILFGVLLLITVSIYYFKDNIIDMVLKEVNVHLKAKVKVEKVELAFWSSFPNLSVNFNKVFIQDTYENSTEKDTLFYSEKVRLRFNPLDIWRENYKLKQIDIYPGTLQLKVDSFGRENYDILKETADTAKTEFEFDLQKVKISNLRFSYTNKKINNLYSTDLIKTELEGKFSNKEFTLHAKSKQIVRETRNGQINFVSNKSADLDINININQEKGILNIPLTTITIANLPFQFSGYLDPNKLKFTIEAKKLSLIDAVNNISMEQAEYFKKHSGSGSVNFLLVIQDNRKDDEALALDCKFGIANGQLIEPTQNIKITELNLNGLFTNKKDNTHLSLNDIRFVSKTGLFKGNLKVSEFNAPRFEGNANGNINLEVVHSLFPIPKIDKLGGELVLNTDFIVKNIPHEDGTNNYDIIKCEGGIELINDYVQLIDDKRYFHSINGKIFLKNNDVGVENLSVKLTNSDLNLNGMFTNLIGFFKDEEKLQADMKVQSNAIYVEDLGTMAKEEQKQIDTPRTFMLPQQVDGKLTLAIGKLSYSKHDFEQIHGSLSLSEHILRFDDIKFKTSGANVTGSVLINEKSESYFHTISTLNSSNIQFKQLMKDWNNFSQNVITSEQISGQAAASLYLDAPFDLRTGINMKNVKADIHLKVENGRLKGVGAFKDIVQSMNSSSAKLVLGAKNIKSFGDRLTDLQFETLENQITIQDGVIIIPEMNINSSALKITARGTHTFENNIDYRFSFRLRDLKEKKTEEFGEVIDDNTGMLVYLKMYGSIDKPQFSWDKESKAEDRKQYNEAEKQNVKGMLKKEFGLFKKDSTVQQFQETNKPKEVLEVQYGESKQESEDFEKEKKKKDTKLNRFFDKMKQEEKEKEKEKIDIEFEFN